MMVKNFCFSRLRKSHSKAQISIEFIAGFGLFMMVVSYVVYTAIIVFPKFYEQSSENAVREEAWTLSVEVMDYLRDGVAANNESLASLSGCRIYHHFDDPMTIDDDLSRANYTYFKSLFSVDELNDFHISVKSSPVVMTEYARGRNRTGNMTFDGVEYMFELFNATSQKYDSVSVSNSSGVVVTTDEEGTVQFGKYTFEVDKIDAEGKFLILGLEDLVSCGKYAPVSAMNSKVTRFTTYNRWITAVDVVYW